MSDIVDRAAAGNSQVAVIGNGVAAGIGQLVAVEVEGNGGVFGDDNILLRVSRQLDGCTISGISNCVGEVGVSAAFGYDSGFAFLTITVHKRTVDSTITGNIQLDGDGILLIRINAAASYGGVV